MTVKHIFLNLEEAIISIELLINVYTLDKVYISHQTFVTPSGKLVSYFELDKQ